MDWRLISTRRTISRNIDKTLRATYGPFKTSASQLKSNSRYNGARSSK